MKYLRLIHAHSLRRCLTLAVAALGISAVGEGASLPPIAPAGANYTVLVKGTSVPYRVSWSQLILKNAVDAPQATISSLSYVRSDISDPSKRPVIFAWGGGPAGSSISICFYLLCPKIASGTPEDPGTTLSDNASSLLDVADIVVIDAPQTGFNRELTPGGGKPYWGLKGDEQAFEALIRDWLLTEKRTMSAVILAGVSYGGTRMGEIAKHVADLNVVGMILVSPGMDLTLQAGDLSAVSSDPHWTGGIEYDQSFVVNLPSLAAAAFAQKKINARGKSVQQIYEEARLFAQTEYVSALQQGAALPAATRDRVASHLSYLIGLPASVIAEANLRVQSQDFLEALVPNYVVSRLDSRLKGPKAPATTGRIRAADDPALHLNKANIRTNTWVADYLRKDVGVKTDQEYVSLNLDVNSAWDWNSGSSSLEDNIVGIDPAPNIGTFMRAHPKTQLLLVSGYYDLAVPALAQSYVLSHAGIPLKRTKIAVYPSGHEVYEDPESRKDVEKEVREFVSLVTD